MMRWGDFRRSDNVEDRTGGMPEGGGGGGFGFGGMRLGGGAMIILVIVGMLFGINPFEMLGMMGGDGGSVQAPPQQSAPPGYGPQTQPSPASPATGTAAVNMDFSRAILGDTEDVWGALFKAMGKRYEPPKLVLYRGGTRSACGRAQAAVGPFYCPADQDLYLDTTFFTELKDRFRAPGEFAQAYVIAHELGHHVQHILGTDAQVRRAEQNDPSAANQYSVRLELQADCFAGVWANSTKQRDKLDPGDIEEGINAAASVGDDRILARSGRRVNADNFTHGSSQQRVSWFRKGFESGDPRACDTFGSTGG
jgi:predicted metalloprotease